MDINIKVNLKSPELVGALLALAEAFGTQGQVQCPSEFTVAKVEAPKIALEDVRAKLAALSQSGKQQQVKALVNKYGASKLTDIPQEKYGEILKDAEAL